MGFIVRLVFVLGFAAASFGAQAQPTGGSTDPNRPATALGIPETHPYFSRAKEILPLMQQAAESCSLLKEADFDMAVYTLTSEMRAASDGFTQLAKLGDDSKALEAKEIDALIDKVNAEAFVALRECGLIDQRDKVIIARKKCDREAEAKAMTQLEKIYRVRNREYVAAQRLGSASRLDATYFVYYVENARSALRKAKEAPWDCPPKDEKPDEVGDASSALPDMTEGENVALEANDPCLIGENGVDPCAGWRPLLGQWRDQRFGGVIEFYMDGENTAGARIVSLSRRMKLQGYSAGMEVLRGLKLQTPGVTRSFSAGGGDDFSAAIEGRDPGSTYGTAEWRTGQGAVFILLERPGILNIVGALEGRLSDYEEWERIGSVTRPI